MSSHSRRSFPIPAILLFRNHQEPRLETAGFCKERWLKTTVASYPRNEIWGPFRGSHQLDGLNRGHSSSFPAVEKLLADPDPFEDGTPQIPSEEKPTAQLAPASEKFRSAGFGVGNPPELFVKHRESPGGSGPIPKGPPKDRSNSFFCPKDPSLSLCRCVPRGCVQHGTLGGAPRVKGASACELQSCGHTAYGTRKL